MKKTGKGVPAPQSLANVEDTILYGVIADELKMFEARLQVMADAEPTMRPDGMHLRRVRRIWMEIDISLEKVRITILCGQCKATDGWVTPFHDRLFRGERGAMSPALEPGIFCYKFLIFVAIGVDLCDRK